MNRRLLLAALFLSLFLVTAYADGEGPVSWSADCRLTWDLFRGTPPPDAADLSEAAAIDMTIEWHVSYVLRPSTQPAGWIGSVQGVTVTNTMDPEGSWVLPGRASDRVLTHEQAHFDLNEVYRRKLVAGLAGITARGGTLDRTRSTLEEEIHRVADNILDRLSDMQERYDEKTKRGTDPEEQAAWEETIAEWLEDPAAAP